MATEIFTIHMFGEIYDSVEACDFNFLNNLYLAFVSLVLSFTISEFLDETQKKKHWIIQPPEDN